MRLNYYNIRAAHNTFLNVLFLNFFFLFLDNIRIWFRFGDHCTR